MRCCLCGVDDGHVSGCTLEPAVDKYIRDLARKQRTLPMRCFRCGDYYDEDGGHRCVPRVRDPHHPERG